MKTLRPITLLAMLVLLTVSLVAAPQPAETGGRMRHRSDIGLRGLELTGEQAEKLAGLRAEQTSKTAQARADLQVKIADLNTLWRAEKLDNSKIIAAVREISGLRQQLAVARAEFRLMMHDLLTPEQREKLRAGYHRMGRVGPGMRGPATPPGRGLGREDGPPGKGLRGTARQQDCEGDCENCHSQE